MNNAEHSLPSEEAILVSLASAGDRAAFDKLVHRYRPVLRALTFLRTRCLVDSDDLVQEILLRMWQKLPGLRRPALFLPWMRTIAANTCSSWYRSLPNQTTSLDTDPGGRLRADMAPAPLESVLTGEKQREIHSALLLLPQANRLALLVHVWGDYSCAEIAAFTEVRVTTVEGRIYRARRQMRQLLRDEGAALWPSRPDDPISESTKEPTNDKCTDQ